MIRTVSRLLLFCWVSNSKNRIIMKWTNTVFLSLFFFFHVLLALDAILVDMPLFYNMTYPGKCSQYYECAIKMYKNSVLYILWGWEKWTSCIIKCICRLVGSWEKFKWCILSWECMVKEQDYYMFLILSMTSFSSCYRRLVCVILKMS